MLALPSAPAPAPRRQVLIGTAVGCAAATTLVGGMLAVWLRFRDIANSAPDGQWVPKKVAFHTTAVPSNVMLLSFVGIVIFAQWAVYSARRNDRPHTGLALGLVGLLGIAVINAQAFIYQRAEIGIAGGNFHVMFYAITGTFVLLLLIGLVFTFVAAFRYLGGRSSDREIVAAHALYWYCLGAIFFALWFVVYVTK